MHQAVGRIDLLFERIWPTAHAVGAGKHKFADERFHRPFLQSGESMRQMV